jgi:pimeloyl-ACP methyl ester carboxylesterase
MTRALSTVMLIAVVAAATTGCGTSFGPQARNGITFYCPGAGNIDFGDNGIRRGLKAAGYRGQVASVMWTLLFNPAIDQTVRLNAHVGAVELARSIEKYQDRFPGRPVNVIGLSAGTGVAIWAVENLAPGRSVDNVVLLSSSLSSNYDMSKALAHIRGRIYNYYSSQDPVLWGPMKVFGTIDGQFLADGAGAVGLHPPSGAGRVVNIRWQREFSRYGYYGGHMDVTSPAFVRARISEHIMETQSGSVEREPARPVARAPRGAPVD